MRRIRSYTLLLLTCICFLLICPKVHAASKEEDKAMGDSYQEFREASDDKVTLRIQSAISNPTAPSGTIAKGVDLSHHNGDVDFAQLKTQIDFAILRCGYGMDRTDQDDRMYETYIAGCRDNKIPFGIYLYSYADTIDKAKSEAQHTLRQLRLCQSLGAKPTLPIFFDMEDNSTVKLSAAMKAQIAKTYCDTLEAAGYTTGIYAGAYWWKNYLTNSYFDGVIRWVAQYNDTLTYSGPCAMWQCSESAVLDGMKDTYDLNYMFEDLFLKEASEDDPVETIDISKCNVTISPVKTYTYCATSIYAPIHVTDGSYTLRKGIDYTLSYKNNLYPGSASVTVTGVGNYTGALSRTYIIYPSRTSISSVKRSKTSATIRWKALKKVSGYQIAYRKKGSKTWKYLLTTNTYRKVTGLAKKEYQVTVRAYVKVGSKKYYGKFSTIKTIKKK